MVQHPEHAAVNQETQEEPENAKVHVEAYPCVLDDWAQKIIPKGRWSHGTRPKSAYELRSICNFHISSPGTG